MNNLKVNTVILVDFMNEVAVIVKGEVDIDSNFEKEVSIEKVIKDAILNILNEDRNDNKVNDKLVGKIENAVDFKNMIVVLIILNFWNL